MGLNDMDLGPLSQKAFEIKITKKSPFCTKYTGTILIIMRLFKYTKCHKTEEGILNLLEVLLSNFFDWVELFSIIYDYIFGNSISYIKFLLSHCVNIMSICFIIKLLLKS
jgi:hypothetical protein